MNKRHLLKFSRTPRDFTALKLWAASRVDAAGDRKTEAVGSKGRDAGGVSPRGAAASTKTVSEQVLKGKTGGHAASAHPHVRPLPALKLEAAPHPTDDFLKSEGD